MQDLAEKDLDENFEYTKTCGKTRNEELTKEIPLQQNSSSCKERINQNPGSTTIHCAGIFKNQKLHEISSSKSQTNNNDGKTIDTSESLRNIQQEIESLLAPLTPLPDLETVPKVVKNWG
eukprot:TRINITY_DN6988_c0_g1_i1.p2 TRINITY_DN6988_c0_g1~~TRINITY_DN6988_c0_g1_i1.p2  ORF type:complete len:120 (-),score=26.66 TRINITY_DN6988_c0_g1_i1:101-460(-)